MNSSFFEKVKQKLNIFFKNLKNLNQRDKYKWISLISVGLVLIVGIFYYAHYKNVKEELNSKAYDVYIGNSKIGVVKDQKKVEKVMNEIETNLSKQYGLEVSVDQNMRFVETNLSDDSLTLESQLKEKIKSNLSFNVFAYAINVNGKDLGAVKTKENAENIINEIKKPYIEESKKEDSKIENIAIAEDVKIIKKKVSIKDIKKPDELMVFLQKGTTEEKTHIVEEGENYWTIAHDYNLTVEELEEANPDKDHELIHPGDEISLVVPKPYLTVETTETTTFSEDIDYEVEYEYSASMYEDQTSVKRSGKEGKKEVVAKVKKQNGIEVAKEIIKESIVSSPVSKIVIKGTKDVPPTRASGVFIRPTRGRLSSPFGYRWGRHHDGIDLASSIGTPIKAADGGVVTYSGWKGSYGYLVEIDHGGGFKTKYGHCSKIYVKKGEKIYKGQTIAAVGNTGNSTGPHVHFEVLKYGKPQNPYNYINKKYR